MRTIAVALGGGGVGKTSVVVNLAAALHQAGQKVLVVDADHQGHVAAFLGLKPEAGLYEFVTNERPKRDCLTVVANGFYVLAGGERLLALREWLYDQPADSRHYVLARQLVPKDGSVDFVLYDTAPGFDIITDNVLASVKEVIAPVQLSSKGIDGLRRLVKHMDRIREHNPSLRLKYLVPTFYERRVVQSYKILHQLQHHYASMCLPPVHRSVKVSEASGAGKNIFQYDKSNVCADDFTQIARRIING